jgi:hypothetical protein
MSFINTDALGDPYGYAIQMDYDVESPNPAYNGFWMKLNALDATSYNALMFYVKGDPQVGFSQRVKIELKDSSNTPSPYLLLGVNPAPPGCVPGRAGSGGRWTPLISNPSRQCQ